MFQLIGAVTNQTMGREERWKAGLTILWGGGGGGGSGSGKATNQLCGKQAYCLFATINHFFSLSCFISIIKNNNLKKRINLKHGNLFSQKQFWENV